MMLKVLAIFGLIYSVKSNTDLSVSSFPTNKYVEYIQGNTYLIISAPHDGTVRLETIPVRKPGCKDKAGKCQYGKKIKTKKCKKEDVCDVGTAADVNASVIARSVYDKFINITGKKPSFIKSNLHRSRLDPNRPLDEAVQGNKEAKKAYDAYHDSIEHAQNTFDGKPGLLLDFHGYADKVKRQNSTMLGYLISKTALNKETYSKKRSSVKALLERTNLTAEEILFGNASLGAMFERSGYKALPSPRQHRPDKDNYFKGGHTIQAHGSRDGGNIDAIQLEFPSWIRTEANEEEQNKFCDQLAYNIAMFYNLYYDPNYAMFFKMYYEPKEN